MPDVDHIAEIVPMASLGEFSDQEPEPEVAGDFTEPPPPEDTVEAEVETEEAEETAEETTETPETPAPVLTAEEAEALKADAEAMKEFRQLLSTLPAAQRDAAMIALGLKQPPPESAPDDFKDYEPANELERAILPALNQVRELPEFIGNVTDAFDRHAVLIDETAIETVFLRNMVEVIAQAVGVDVPTLDAAAVRKEAYNGKDHREIVKALVKPLSEKAAAIKAQNARAAKAPRTPGNASGNGAEVRSGKLIDYFRASPVE